MKTPLPGITLYSTKLSAHGQRVEMLLRALGLPYRYEHTSYEARKTAEFLKINPKGQIPVLCDDGTYISDSHAMLVYLARRYDPDRTWLPKDPLQAAQVQMWLSTSAGEIAHGLALPRAILNFGAPQNLAQAQVLGTYILTLMDQHLDSRVWLASEANATIADLACYGYISTAPEAGLSLEPHQHVTRWLSQIKRADYFVPIPPVPDPEA